MIIINATVVSAEYNGGKRMKTRIISGVVAALAVAGLLLLNSYFHVTVIIAVAVLAAIAVYEMLYRTGAVKNKVPVIIAMVYVAALQFSYKNLFIDETTLTVIFALIIAVIAVVKHNTFDVPQITATVAMPVMLGFSFACIASLINANVGLLYFILLFNFACVTDIGAYFVGSAIGKHKLAPEISPKKTVEGAIGGIVCSVIGTVIISLVFQAVLNKPINILALTVATPVFSVLGMFGDLFASVIKRYFGIKDYGNIMPGHGGVLDRTDSILIIAPALILFLNLVSVI